MPINIFRSWKSDCWKGDLEQALEVYTDQELAEIRDHGFNGIWLHQKLSDYTPSCVLPALGTHRDRYLPILEELVLRAKRHHLKVYLYLLEPRAIEISDAFWDQNSDLRGQYWKQPIYDREYYGLCSSHPVVREYLQDSMAKLTQRLPDLAGFFVITSGEDFSTCICKLWDADHFSKTLPGVTHSAMESDLTCPRCQHKTPVEVISELLATLHEGITAGNPHCKLLAWNWGWDRLPSKETEARIAERIPKEIILLSDFEIGGSKNILGKTRPVNEYSLSYVGPSPRFRKSLRISRASDRSIGAKFQVGATHELATVPNLPLIHNLFRKVIRAQAQGVNIALATWNMGNMRTLNTYAFGHAFSQSKPCDFQTFYHGIIRRYLQVDEVVLAKLVTAWKHFARAFRHFPYSTQFIYRGPVNYAPAYWLPPRPIQGTPTGMSCDVPTDGDDLESCLGGYTVEEVIKGFDCLARHWQSGVSLYESVLNEQSSERLREEYYSAYCALSVFRSAKHIYQAYQICADWNEHESLDRYLAVSQRELENSQMLLPFLRKDKRLGFHTECQQYLFSEDLVLQKIETLKNHLALAEPHYAVPI